MCSEITQSIGVIRRLLGKDNSWHIAKPLGRLYAVGMQRVLVKDVIRAIASVTGVSEPDVMRARDMVAVRRIVCHLAVHRYGHYVSRVALTIGVDRSRVNQMLREPLVTDTSAIELTARVIRELERAQDTHRNRCADAIARRSQAGV